MNRNPLATLAVSTLARRATQALRLGAALGALVLAACSAGGGPGVSVNQPTGSATAQSYTGPAAMNADVLAFQLNLWQNITPSDRCGGCHHAGGQSPQFARSDDVNLPYRAVLPP